MRRLSHLRRYLAATALSLGLCAQPAPGQTSSTAPGPASPAQPAPRQWQYYPQPPQAPAGAPNVLLIMTDDVGFGSTSTFGGPIPTPTFDALARNGIRYNAFYTTAMCSPSRAALLTGRNAHAVASGSITNVSIDEPGYTSVIPKSAATIGRVLHDSGYDTAFFGKNHNTPLWETGPMGPFDRWPNGLGFDYFYGYNAAAEDQFRPSLIENRNPVAPGDAPDYIFDKDMTDHLVHWLRVKQAQKPDNPFFIYLSPGTMHSPHQAPADWIARFKGQFDMGWDALREQIFARQKAMGIIPADAELTPRPDVLPAWESLSPDARKTYARQMEVAAAQLAYFDDQTGRILDQLRASGELENTLVIYVQGDNGASMDSRLGAVQELQSLLGVEPTEAELIAKWDQNGTRHSYSNYNAAWAWAQNAPFPWGKQIASHLGGLRDGLVISWPARIRPDTTVRDQFHHLIDVAPTIYEAAGITPPDEVDGVKQQPIDGVSMLYSFADAEAPSTRHAQYFEMLGNRSYYKDGWLAATIPPRAPFDRAGEPLDPDDFEWALFNLETDFSQARNIAAQHPAKLAELRADFEDAARRYHVNPIAADLIGRVPTHNRPSLIAGRDYLVFPAGSTIYPHGNFPDLAPGWTMTATITTTAGNASGPIVIKGDEAGGAGLYLDAGTPVYLYNPTAREEERVTLTGAALPPGEHGLSVAVEAQPQAGPRAARIVLRADGREVASHAVPVFYKPRGSGVVGRYGVRTLLKDLPQPAPYGIAIDRVEFQRDASAN